MLQNASNMFFKKETKQNKTTTEKRKNLTQRELNPKPLTCEGNALSIAPRNHCKNHMSNQLYLTFLSPRDKLFKMAQKIQTYDEMSTTKGHP